MRAHCLLVTAVLPATLGLAACGGSSPATRTVAGTAPALPAPAAQPPAPRAAGALAEIPDVPAARRRVGYVDPSALAALTTPGDAARITRGVLGPGAAALAGRDDGAVTTAVRVGDATVLRGPGMAQRRSVIGSGTLAARLAEPRPARSVIQPTSPSAVQSCLGDAAAQTLVGADTLGRDTTMGVGLRGGQDAPAGLKLVVCVSPRYRKQLYGAVRAMERRFGRPDAADPRGVVVGEDEVGEQQIARGVVPAEALAPAELAAYLAGGARLRSLLPEAPS